MTVWLTRRDYCKSISSAICAPCLSWAQTDSAPHVIRLADWAAIPVLQRLHGAFEWLTAASVLDKPPGRYPVDGDRMYATIAQDSTRVPLSGQFEAHRKYIDIHYLVRGREMIGSAPASRLEVKQAYNAETDAALFAVPARYERLILGPGDLAVFFPGQAHLPGCQVDGAQEIKKAVVKVLASR